MEIRIVALLLALALLSPGTVPAADPPASLDPFAGLPPLPRRAFARLDGITYQSSGKWDPTYEKQAKEGAELVAKWGLKVPRPPANSSERTARELRYLKERKAKRSKEKLANAEKQKDLSGFVFGDYRYGAGARPKTDALMKYTSGRAAPAVFALKMKFDRARPSALDEDIEPAMKNPPHAAYPSGHATQAYLLAHVLASLEGTRKAEAVKAARAIAQNREVVGVHYPSDSEAGRQLARQIYESMVKDPEFKRLLAEAKTEF